MRLVFVDTETTGINKRRKSKVSDGHRIIEIACIEVVDGTKTGRQFHVYINPGQQVDPKAVAVHGITDDFLKGMPLFSDIADPFIKFISGSVVVMHNAPFDIAFIDQEFVLANANPVGTFKFIDTLKLAREKHPGLKNTLDALASRYQIESHRGSHHGALVDTNMLINIFPRLIL